MIIEKAKVIEVRKLTEKIFLLIVFSPKISRQILPGQFCNIKVSETDFPLLRRPFSICDVEGDKLFFMFDVHGEGTKILSTKQEGDIIDILGPLGNGFSVSENIDSIIILAGGLGIAPFPYLIRKYKSSKNIISYIGGKNKDYITSYGMVNQKFSTDDGSIGFHGSVLQLFESEIKNINAKNFIILACGPTAMLKAVKSFCEMNNFNCEISTESAMACGFGICQGCPIEKENDDGSFFLVCKDGPVFNIKDVKL